MKLPNADRAVVDIEKLRRYCLNRNHPRGKHKARVFESVLGLKLGDAVFLRRALLDAALTHEATAIGADIYGERYVIDFELATTRGEATVRSSWIVLAKEDFPRLVSCCVL